MADPGIINTYDLNVGTMLDVEDVIRLISPDDTPLLGGMDVDGRSILPRGEIEQKKYDWLDDVLLRPISTCAVTINSSATKVQPASGDLFNFQAGDVIITPAGEYILVTGYDNDGVSLDIVRGYAASTAASINSADVLRGVGMALIEGSDPPAARAKDRVDRTNYTQIFGPTQIAVSGTEQVIRKYGLRSTEFDYQTALRIREQAIALNIACYYGTAYQGDGTHGRLMGGMKSFVSTNVDASTTALTYTAVNSLMESCYKQGGKPDRIFVGTKQKKTISTFDSTNVRITSTGAPEGGSSRGYNVTELVTDFGDVLVCLDRYVADSDAFLIERDATEISTLRPFHFAPLAKTGDSVKGMVVGEYGFKFKVQAHSGRFATLT